MGLEGGGTEKKKKKKKEKKKKEKEKKKKEKEKKKKKFPLCESIGHRPFWGHCPKVGKRAYPPLPLVRNWWPCIRPCL